MIDLKNIEYELPKEDNFYKYKGVKPPERRSHGISEDDIDELIKGSGSHVCNWRQKGNYIFCVEGPNEHGKNIGVHKQLTGTKDGKPILSERRTIYRK